MATQYDRHMVASDWTLVPTTTNSGDDAMEVQRAAQAVREVEVEAAQSAADIDSTPLEQMSIDELRKVAASLNIPDRAQIVEQAELVAEIRRRL